MDIDGSEKTPNELKAEAMLKRLESLGAKVFYEKQLTSSDVSASGRVVVPKVRSPEGFPSMHTVNIQPASNAMQRHAMPCSRGDASSPHCRQLPTVQQCTAADSALLPNVCVLTPPACACCHRRAGHC